MSDNAYADHVQYADSDPAYLAMSTDFYSNPVKGKSDGTTREVSFSCSVLPEQGVLLYDLVRHLRPEHSLEIGLAWGGSAIHILAAIKANAAGDHVALDPMQEAGWSGVGVAEPQRLGLGDHFIHISDRSDVVLPRFVEEGRRFQFVFIDGDHRFDAVFVDFHFCQRLLDVGGVIVFDDAKSPGIHPVIDFITTNMSHLKLMDVPTFGRFAAFKKVGEDERSIGYSMPFYN